MKTKQSVILVFLKLMKVNQFSNIFAKKLTKKRKRKKREANL